MKVHMIQIQIQIHFIQIWSVMEYLPAHCLGHMNFISWDYQ